YCENPKMAGAKLESYDLDLVPGTKVFRHEISAAPGKEAWMSLSARFAFVFAESKTGRLLEIKRTSREEAPDRFYSPLFEAMKKAGRKVKSEKDATAVLRNLMVLEGYLWNANVNPGRAKSIEARGQFRARPNTFSGGNYNWMYGECFRPRSELAAGFNRFGPT